MQRGVKWTSLSGIISKKKESSSQDAIYRGEYRPNRHSDAFTDKDYQCKRTKTWRNIRDHNEHPAWSGFWGSTYREGDRRIPTTRRHLVPDEKYLKPDMTDVKALGILPAAARIKPGNLTSSIALPPDFNNWPAQLRTLLNPYKDRSDLRPFGRNYTPQGDSFVFCILAWYDVGNPPTYYSFDFDPKSDCLGLVAIGNHSEGHDAENPKAFKPVRAPDVTEVYIRSASDNEDINSYVPAVTGLSFITTKAGTKERTAQEIFNDSVRTKGLKVTAATAPADGTWKLYGFYRQADRTKRRIERLGFIWEKM